MSDSTQSNDEKFDSRLVDEAVQALNNGETILYPTDTVWGLGCDPFDKKAVQRLRSVKKCSEDKKFILLVHSEKELKRYINKIHPRVETLLSHHQRPLTVVYGSVRRIPDYLVADDGSVAMRIVQDDFCREVIARFGKPIISTSANISGEESPSHFGEISSDILEGADHVVKYRQDEEEEAVPSTIATFDKDGKLAFIRE